MQLDKKHPIPPPPLISHIIPKVQVLLLLFIIIMNNDTLCTDFQFAALSKDELEGWRKVFQATPNQMTDEHEEQGKPFFHHFYSAVQKDPVAFVVIVHIFCLHIIDFPVVFFFICSIIIK